MNKSNFREGDAGMSERRPDAARHVVTGRLLHSWQPPTVVELKMVESAQGQQRVQLPENHTRN